MSRSAPSERKKREMNSEPRSEETWPGAPCLEKTWSKKEASQFFRVDRVRRRNEYPLLCEAIHDNQYRGVAVRRRKLFDEIHGDRIPRANRNRKRFETSIGFVAARLISGTSDTGLHILADQIAESGPVVLARDRGESLVLTGVSGE